MWFTLLSSVFSFLGGPVAKGLVDSYKAKLAAGNTSERIAADLAGKEIGAQQAETQALVQLRIAQIGHPWEPEKIAFYITMVPYAKIMIWDKTFGFLTHGSTDAITGAVGVWAGLIMTFYFGRRGFENVARIMARK